MEGGGLDIVNHTYKLHPAHWIAGQLSYNVMGTYAPKSSF